MSNVHDDSGIHQIGVSSGAAVSVSRECPTKSSELLQTFVNTGMQTEALADKLTTKSRTGDLYVIWPFKLQYQVNPKLPHGTVVIQQMGGNPVLQGLKGRCSNGFGIAQLVLSLALIALNISSFALEAIYRHTSHGFWSSIFFVMSGVLAIITGKKKTYSLVSATLGTNIMSAVVATTGLALSITALIAETDVYGQLQSNKLALHSLMMFAFLCEITCSTAVSVLCCHGGACCPGNSCCPACDTEPNVVMPFDPLEQTASVMMATSNGKTHLRPISHADERNS